jgi:signal peptidase II
VLESFIKYYLILNKIPKAGFYFFNGLLQISYFQNQNIAFGIPLTSGLIIAIVIVILILLSYLWWLAFLRFSFWQIFALSLIILGALSNMLDRLIFGFVIDYINIFIWPVFNLADAMIVIGVALYFLFWKKVRV